MNIRPLNGSKWQGFEELCAQLARAEAPANSRFERKGTPDAGVECFCVLPDGSEWGWQAKYFDQLGRSQFEQLNRSVETALEKHPRLVRYFVCAPLDRADARLATRESAMDRWDKHVAKWRRCADHQGRTIEFVWWGSSELIERLSRSENIGRVFFWFGKRGFDKQWFAARLDEAVDAAGPRYTPEIHLEIPIAADLDCFGRTTSSIDSVKARAKGIRKVVPLLRNGAKDCEAPLPTDSIRNLLLAVNAVLQSFSNLVPHPAGYIPLGRVLEQISEAESIASNCRNSLSTCTNVRDRQHSEESGHPGNRPNHLQNWIYYIEQLLRDLHVARSAVERATSFSNANLMILRGSPGTGKTHLLCDFASRMVSASAPTILLMGQRFLSTEDPWEQALQQLDVSGITTEEFVGAIEAAAQAAQRRAVLIIDALNEGQGRTIWPPHLAAFLAPLLGSPWISVLLSVRATYMEDVIPEAVRTNAVPTVHEGFADREYDAVRTFFSHYELELPSAPILFPEFRNPLFLKTICRGLRDLGKRRLPRGFHGITAIFDLYLRAADKRLGKDLNYDARDRIVQKALINIAKWFAVHDKRWLPRSEARAAVDVLLPGRDYDRSLYWGLVSEGVLVEEMNTRDDDEREEVVFLSYDRYADHAITDIMLKTHLDIEAPQRAFAKGGGLEFLSKERYVASGLIEALCIQIPERVGTELVSIAPMFADRTAIRDAFRQSLVWRRVDAFSKSTFDLMHDMNQSEEDFEDTLEVLLTVASIPNHPLNGEFLDKYLRHRSMADRDAMWSIYLHRAWESRGAVDRIVDWASDVGPDIDLDDRADELCAIALAWMLTTSNRFLRDRATKAMISLLTGRLETTQLIVERFSDAKDLYILERVYAVAYGVVMRDYDPAAVGEIAAKVYDLVFAEAVPPAHILLRDYARGVIERALWLGAEIEVNEELIRPPYASTWPTIPSDGEIEPYLKNWSAIRGSVMGGDFGRYVIGTNTGSSNWLQLRLEEPTWQSSDSRMRALLPRLSEASQESWAQYIETESELTIARVAFGMKVVGIDIGEDDEVDCRKQERYSGDDKSTALAESNAALEAALVEFLGTLTPDQRMEVDSILEHRKEGGNESAPSFDLNLIQRYVLKRVFDLGWTVDRFGYFDRYETRSYTRDASKAERVGKKYQWIAYHEILAYIADHYQYRDGYRDDEDQFYQGPWQEHLRDIDPSITLLKSRGDEWIGHQGSWWAGDSYVAWGEESSLRDWMKREDDIPNIAKLLVSREPKTDISWVNLHGFLNCRQPHVADEEWWDKRRRELWLICIAYFVRSGDTEMFMEWAGGVEFGSMEMPDPPAIDGMFVGEFGWSEAYKYMDHLYFGMRDSERPERDCPVPVRVASVDCSCKPSNFDCSIEDSVAFRLPHYDFVEKLKLRWAGRNAEFLDECSEIAVFDPTVDEEGPPAVLARDDLMRRYLKESDMELCWTVVGEKRVVGGGLDQEFLGALRISGAYVLEDEGPTGFLNFRRDRLDEGTDVDKSGDVEKSGTSGCRREG